MYKVSDLYKTKIKEDVREHYIQGSMTLTSGKVINLNMDNIVKGSITVQNQCVNGSTFELGSVYVGTLSFSLYTDADRYSLFGAVVKMSYFIKIDLAYEEVELGVYTVTEAERTTKYISINAYDNMQMLDAPFANTGVNGTPYEILSYVSFYTGIEIGNSENEINLMPNGDTELSFPPDTDSETYRDLIHYLSIILGGFATVDRKGRLIICQFSKAPCDTITSDKRNNAAFSDFIVKYNCIEMIVDDENMQVFSVEEKGQTLTLDSNPFLVYGLRDRKVRLLQNLIDNISKLEYTPSDINYLSNPAYELGDMIEHKDIAKTLIMSMSWTYGGQQNIKAVGRNPALIGIKSRTEKQINNALNGNKGSVNKVVHYTNGKEINIGAASKKIFECYFLYSNESIPLFHSSIILDIKKEGIFEINYILNGNTAIHKPIYQLLTGKTTLTLFYPIINVLCNINNTFNVTIKSYKGEGYIAFADAVCTLTGTGLVNGTEDWDGTLNFEDYYAPVILSGIPIVSLKENNVIKQQIPYPITQKQEYDPVWPTVAIKKINDNEAGFTIEKNGFEIEGAFSSLGFGIRVAGLTDNVLIEEGK